MNLLMAMVIFIMGGGAVTCHGSDGHVHDNPFSSDCEPRPNNDARIRSGAPLLLAGP